MRGHISNHAATVAEVLRDEGYATFAVGKWHLCQMEDASAAGPYDQWPCQRGFDRFYGFLDGETDQFHPDARLRQPPRRPARHAPRTATTSARTWSTTPIEFIHDTKSIRPDRPFFLYLAFGATHAPHQAPADVPREVPRARSTPAGTSPASSGSPARRSSGLRARRTPSSRPATRASRRGTTCPRTTGGSPPACRRRSPPSSTTPTTRSAGSSTRSSELGELDNTIIVLLSDNGASQEGGPFGVLHEMKFFNFILETPDEAIERLDDIGGPHSHTNYPWGWAQAGNTPFKWYKQNTHEGGVHVPLHRALAGRDRRRAAACATSSTT